MVKKVGSEDQKWFRSTIGSLFNLVKLPRSDISNAVRELSKVGDGSGPAHVRESKMLVYFVCCGERKFVEFNFEKDKIWEIEAYSGIDFAGDKDEKKSVTGYVVLVNNTPISWKSKAQPIVTLSSTEADYVALNETVKEIKFVAQLMKTMGFSVKLPATVWVDNIGAIFLSIHKTSGERSKHIDIKYYFLSQRIEFVLIDIKFVRSKENLADLFSKNLGC
jgi:hypothetical protein